MRKRLDKSATGVFDHLFQKLAAFGKPIRLQSIERP